MASLFPVSKMLLSSGGIFYILKTLFSRQFFLFFNQNEPIAIMLLFLVNNLLDILLMENVTTNYNFRWADILQIYGDIYKNPGPPPPQKTEHLCLMHWNLNLLKKDNFFRVSRLQAYNSIYNCHIMAISEYCPFGQN